MQHYDYSIYTNFLFLEYPVVDEKTNILAEWLHPAIENIYSIPEGVKHWYLCIFVCLEGVRAKC